VYRTDLITDPEVLARVDPELALRVRRWPSMTRDLTVCAGARFDCLAVKGGRLIGGEEFLYM
jgi:hypothetical protein